MIQIEDSVVMDELLEHIAKERARAKLSDKPFVLGVATDKKNSQILPLIRTEENEALLREIGLTDYEFHWDALRSSIRLAGEELIISICSPR
jgi:hypothetical protein